MEKNRQILALPKKQLIAAWWLSGDELALSVIACAMPPLPKGEAFASRKACPLCPRLSLWESWRGAPERARMLARRLLLLCTRHGILGKAKTADPAGKSRNGNMKTKFGIVGCGFLGNIVAAESKKGLLED